MNSDTLMTMPVAPTGYAGGGMGMGGWGQDWFWIVILLLFGWGNNGWGNNGGGMNGGVGSEVQRGFDHSSVVTKLDGITQGICDSTYALNNTATTGFANAELGAANRQAALMQGQNALASQLAQCCCDNREAISAVRYDMATQACDTRNTIQNTTRDIIDSHNAGTQAILGKLSQMEFNDLNSKYQAALTENQSLKFQASQTAQNGFIDAVGNSIVAQLRHPTPVPAYQVPNPYASYGYGCGACACA